MKISMYRSRGTFFYLIICLILENLGVYGWTCNIAGTGYFKT